MNRPVFKIGNAKVRMAGFSLVEVMVALVISLFILGGAITVLIQNQQNYRHNDDFGRLQENARFALELITSDLRMAGFLGCSINLQNPLNTNPGNGALHDTTFALNGYEGGTTVWLPHGNAITPNIVANTDAITIRKLRNAGVPITAGMAAPNSPITVPNGQSPVNSGQLAAIYDCNGTEIFRANVAGDTLTPAAPLSRAYGQNQAYITAPDPNGLNARTFVAAFDTVRYYIALSDGQPALWREIDNGASIAQQVLVEGIDTMQILYGENDSAFGEPNFYVTADNVTDWSRVVAVKVTLLVSTVDEYGSDTDSKTYTIDDVAFDAFNDRRSRKQVSATVLLRNLQTKLGA